MCAVCIILVIAVILFLPKCAIIDYFTKRSKQNLKSQQPAKRPDNEPVVKNITIKLDKSANSITIKNKSKRINRESRAGFSFTSSGSAVSTSSVAATEETNNNNPTPTKPGPQLNGKVSQRQLDVAEPKSDETPSMSPTSQSKSFVESLPCAKFDWENSQRTQLSASEVLPYVAIQEKPYKPVEVRVLEEFREGKRPRPTLGYHRPDARRNSLEIKSVYNLSINLQ